MNELADSSAFSAALSLCPLRSRAFTAEIAENSRRGRGEKQDRQTASPTKFEGAQIAAMQARLGVIESEIVRLTNLASRTEDQDQQEKYWALAQDLQREAREVRAEIYSRVPHPSW